MALHDPCAVLAGLVWDPIPDPEGEDMDPAIHLLGVTTSGGAEALLTDETGKTWILAVWEKR